MDISEGAIFQPTTLQLVVVGKKKRELRSLFYPDYVRERREGGEGGREIGEQEGASSTVRGQTL